VTASGPALASIETALDHLRLGRPVVVVDDESRENEGDVVLSAELASQAWTAWMVRVSSGFVCAPMTGEIADRRTLRVLADAGSVRDDLHRPGHVLPLRAVPGGVLARDGHTEAAVDLMLAAGLRPVAAISEIVGDDGEMMRLPGLLDLGAREGVPVVTIAQLVDWRREHDVDGVVTPVPAAMADEPRPARTAAATDTTSTTTLTAATAVGRTDPEGAPA